MSGHQSVRVDNDRYETLRRWAEEEDRPIARVLGSAVDLYDEIQTAKVSRAGRDQRPGGTTASKGAADLGGSHVARPHDQPESSVQVIDSPPLVVDGKCPHPRDKERRLSWGVVCDACGTKLR